ncbi:pyridoxamine 5'-phosphate oxidase [Bacteroidia bacterium]|nr:pyridoxamine 5'-phosphate oxidase [Bacteroidia bacterium]
MENINNKKNIMKFKSILIVNVLLLAFCPIIHAQTNEKKGEQPMKEVCEFLKACGHYFIATVDGDQPHVRPFGTAAIFENKLYIQTGKRKKVAKQMMANPKIEICAYNATKGQWLRIEATVTPDERIEAKQFMLDEYPSLKSMYAANDDNTFVLYLENVTATFNSFSDEPRVVKF